MKNRKEEEEEDKKNYAQHTLMGGWFVFIAENRYKMFYFDEIVLQLNESCDVIAKLKHRLKLAWPFYE